MQLNFPSQSFCNTLHSYKYDEYYHHVAQLQQAPSFCLFVILEGPLFCIQNHKAKYYSSIIEYFRQPRFRNRIIIVKFYLLPHSSNVTEIPDNAMPLKTVLQVWPGRIESAAVSVPVVTISPD